jgi:hypothetical protein
MNVKELNVGSMFVGDLFNDRRPPSRHQFQFDPKPSLKRFFNAFLNSAPGGTETTTLPSFLAAAMMRCHSACQSEVGLSAALPDVESSRRATKTVVVLVMKPFVQHRPVVGHPLIATHVFER